MKIGKVQSLENLVKLVVSFIHPLFPELSHSEVDITRKALLLNSFAKLILYLTRFYGVLISKENLKRWIQHVHYISPSIIWQQTTASLNNGIPLNYCKKKSKKNQWDRNEINQNIVVVIQTIFEETSNSHTITKISSTNTSYKSYNIPITLKVH